MSEISFLVTPLQRPEVSACNRMCAQNKLRFSKRFLVITFIAYRGVFLVMLVYVFPSPALCHKGNGCRKLAHYFKVALCILSNLGLCYLLCCCNLFIYITCSFLDPCYHLHQPCASGARIRSCICRRQSTFRANFIPAPVLRGHGY